MAKGRFEIIPDENLIAQLPLELQLEILSRLSPEQVSRFATTGLASYDFVKRSNYWRDKFRRHFPHLFAKISVEEAKKLSTPGVIFNWFDKFKKAYETEYQFNNADFGYCYEVELRRKKHRLKRLFTLVKEGDAEGLKAENITRDDLARKDANGKRLLTWALDPCPNQAVADLIYNQIRNGEFIDPDTKTIKCQHHDQANITLVGWAIYCRQPIADIQALLLQSSTETFNSKTVQNDRNLQPAHLAAMKGRLDLLKFLIDEEPEEVQRQMLEAKDVNGRTPLMLAAEFGYEDIVAYLIDKQVQLDNVVTGSDDDRINLGKTAFWLAFEFGYMNVARRLLKAGANPRVARVARHSDRDQLIHSLVKSGSLASVQELLEWCPELINEGDFAGQTPLLWAAANGHMDIVKLLLAQHKPKPDLEAATNGPGQPTHGGTAFWWAFHYRHYDIMSLLAKAGAVTTVAIGAMGKQAVHVAAAAPDRFFGLEELLKINPDLINARDAFGKTPLIWAVEGHRDEKVNRVKTLLARDNIDLEAAINHPGHIEHGKTAFYRAVECGYSHIALMLLERGAVTTTVVNGLQAIHLAMEWPGTLEMAQKLIEAQPGLLDQPDAHGRTPLMIAVNKGDLAFVRYLLSKKPKANTVITDPAHQDEGKTALHLAVLRNNLEMVRSLHEYDNSLLEMPDKYGQTPLLEAAARGYPEITEYLLSQHAKMDVKTQSEGHPNHGKSPLIWAFERNRHNIEDMLIDAGAAKLAANDPEQKELAWRAARSGDLKLLTAMVNANPLLLQEYNQGQRLLTEAIRNGQNEVVLELLRRKKAAGLDFSNEIDSSRVDTSRLNNCTRGVIAAIRYRHVRAQQGDYTAHIDFFCFRFNFNLGVHKNKKLAAADALIAHSLFGGNANVLQQHHEALHDGQLNRIRKQIMMP